MASSRKKTTKTADQIKAQEKVQSPKDHEPVPEEDQRTREFLFKTFHDMRNPLHAIMGYTSLVLRKTRDQIPEKQQENLEKVLQSAERLNEIVDRMVAFYREK
jgi:signal transduction histidine kinase